MNVDVGLVQAKTKVSQLGTSNTSECKRTCNTNDGGHGSSCFGGFLFKSADPFDDSAWLLRSSYFGNL